MGERGLFMAHQTNISFASRLGHSASPVSSDELREIFDALDHGLCIVEVQFDERGRCVDYVFIEVNDAFERQTGLHEATGRSMRVMRPEHEEHWFEIYGEIARTGTPRRFTAPAAALGRWYDVYAFRVGEPAKNRVAILFDDISDRKQAEERYALLNSETEHRSRNLFALFEGLIRLTREETVEMFKAVLIRRMRALLASNHVGGEAPGTVCNFTELAQREMAPYQSGSGRIAMSGPPVALNQVQSDCLSMILHELATNALKYGALSDPDGSISLMWELDGGRLRISWREMDGPPVAQPSAKGLGSNVIERCVRDLLDGEIMTRWHPTGVEYDVALPLTARMN